MKIYVYIDGFNLYYGCLKDTPYRWLNVSKLCSFLFPHDEIVKVKYFIAPIKIRKNDTDYDRPNRQQIYFRALRTLSNVEIIEGTFLSHKVMMKLAHEDGFACVIKNEEKGTDVNIATHLMHDAHNKIFDRAVVITNDSDLIMPISILTNELGQIVTVISPYNTNNIQLKEVASNVKRIRNGVLRVSQFEEILQDHVGDFSMPYKWKMEARTRVAGTEEE